MTTAHIKSLIKEKFGTISSFARAAKIDRYEFLQKPFSRDNLTDIEREGILKLIEETPEEKPAIDPEKLELLKTKIEEYGGLYKFGKDNGKEFDMRQLYLIYNGKMKTKSKQVVKLFKHFEIE